MLDLDAILCNLLRVARSTISIFVFEALALALALAPALICHISHELKYENGLFYHQLTEVENYHRRRKNHKKKESKRGNDTTGTMK